MFSATDLLDALRRRTRKSIRPGRLPGEFPPGWAAWFVMMGERIGAVTGAAAEAIVAIFLQRELAVPPRRAGELNRWQSFATLWRQQWQPPEPEERRVRLLAIAITFVVHVLLLIILLWLAYVRFSGAPAPAGEEVVQVEYVGQGTPELAGGGPPTSQARTPATARSAPAPAAGRAARPHAAASSQPAPAPPSEHPKPPAPTAVPSAQPLQVSEKPVPDSNFVLPATTPRRIDLPQQVQLSVPKLQVPTREVELIESPPPVRAIQPALPTTTIIVPTLKTQPTPVTLATPSPAVATRPAPSAAPQASPSPAPAIAAASTATAVQPAAHSGTGNASAGAEPISGGPPAARTGTQQTATASGSGPSSIPKPGAWPTPKRGDDWGASTRNRPGGNAGTRPGLFNADGSPRLAAGTAAAGGGFPPGSDHWTRDQIDRAGTWLKRPPNDYTPTRFDQYWLPAGTLLEEWVRRGIREVAIPIPGTSKKISCTISVLQLGGACGISDPNLNDQEATARPPPDVPFKPELQEDQQSLHKPGTP